MALARRASHGKRSRKRRRGTSAKGAATKRVDGAAATDQDGQASPSDQEGRTASPAKPAAYARSEAKNQAARDSLVPLREGERPRAVTVGAVVAAVSGVLNAAYVLGLGSGEQPVITAIGFSVLMLIIAWGMWRSRYWAVLGMQALLGITLVVIAVVVLVQATLLQAVILTVLVLVPAGALFWFLVRAMARIQMPQRR